MTQRLSGRVHECAADLPRWNGQGPEVDVQMVGQTDRWPRVEALLDAALDLAPAERAGFLLKACPGDESLRAEVERLLDACERAESFLEEPALRLSVPMSDRSAGDGLAEGTRIGAYRILRELGRGGMGAVYLAERDDGEFSMRVALKIVRPDARAGGDVLRRFRAERQILASLDHPYLARLLDGGVTPDGLPYFAMEYVEGERIDRFCDAHLLAVDDRIRLFLALCDAVAYAHGQAVLHRDIKPSNVLVTGAGTVKLLDFGIAKLLTPGTGEALTLTRAGAQPLTPEYASPEQLRGGPATPATDVFALGVLLHELVTGTRAAPGAEPRELVSADGSTWDEAARLRDTTVPRLRRQLRGGLGWILRKALRADSSERYATVEEMAADLRRELEGRRVQARHGAGSPLLTPPFRRRTLLALGVGVAGLVAIFALVIRIPGRSLAAAEARQASHAPSGRTTVKPTLAVLPFVNLSGDPRQEYLSDGMTVELLDALSQLPALDVVARSSSFSMKGRDLPAQLLGRKLKASHLLEGSVQRDGDRVRISVQLVDAGTGYPVWSSRYDRKFNDLFDLEDEIGRSVAQTLRARLAVPGGAPGVPLVRTATTNPDAHEAYLRGAFFLAKHNPADLHRALTYFRQALAADSMYAPAWAGLGDAYGWLAGVFVRPDSAYPLAESAYRKALALDPTLPGVHADLGWLNVFYYRNWPAAMAEFDEAQKLDPATSRFLWLSFRGRLAEAIPDAARARRRNPLSPMTSDLTAWVYVFAHQYDRAIAWAREGLELDSTYYYGDSPLAEAYLGERRFPEAIAIYERQRQRQHGLPSPPLVMAYARAGRISEARRTLAEVLALRQRQRVQPGQIAGAYAWLGERDSAFAWLDRAFTTRDATVTFLRVYPWFDPLRSDPRFPAMLRRAGLM